MTFPISIKFPLMIDQKRLCHCLWQWR